MHLIYFAHKNDTSIRQILKEYFYMSERYILKLKKNDCIFLNSEASRIYTEISAGDKLEIIEDLEEDNSNIVPASNIKLNIVYEDEYLLILNKQAGIPVHPSMAHFDNSLSNGVRFYFDNIGLKKKIRPVNRLDKDTSGLVIFAKNEYIQECLVKQMKLGIFKKKYIAILEGILEKKSGTINSPIARKEGSIIERCISENGDASISHYKVIKESDNLSVVEFTLETGRTHQIRVHSSHIGHPILGDTLYGRPSNLISRQALHSYYISFNHPITRKEVKFEIPLPEDMEKCQD